ncbi:MAG TPA: CRTAC1 family protein, partial [Isosphaeraceae bacterium]|nr:CRTAC1 family protein [Isosphaeraceae bacterium]
QGQRSRPVVRHGPAVGDWDGDGRDDLFVTGWRDQRLYHNEGGTFLDVTERAGLSSNLWSTSAAFADLDGDGDFDLYVATYVHYDADHPTYCAAPDGRRDYCGPEEYAAQPDRLYRNNGDGTFTDVSREACIALPNGRGLGVLIAELTGDNLPDIFVANDGTPCWLFANRGGLRFEEVGQASGVALDGNGNPLAGMGVALGDVDGDARADLIVTNFYDSSTIAFQSLGGGRYQDASAAFGLAAPTRKCLGFGVTLTDFDADGHLDLVQANGHVLDRARLGIPFAMKPIVLRNTGGRLADVSATAGPWFSEAILGRGLAVGDIDHDGRPDVVVNALDAPAAILKNVAPVGHWLTLDLAARAPLRSAIGARVRATIGGKVLLQQVVGGGSYLSALDRKVYLGLSDAKHVDRLEVTWPSGRIEEWRSFAADQVVSLEEGTGFTTRPASPGTDD